VSSPAQHPIAERFSALGRRVGSHPDPARIAAPPLGATAISDLLGFGELEPSPLVATLEIPGHAPRWAWPHAPLPPRLAAHLRKEPGRLFVHQARVADEALAGRHVVLATPTASGKSLAFLVPALAALERNPLATIIALYPTKALAHDQLQRLRTLEAALRIPCAPAVYDGDTPPAERSRIKEVARFVVTNPHGLNLYLGWHEGWQRLLANLAFVIVDETHAYTGELGGAVGWLLRRLRRLARAHGADPVFVGASGTIANPVEHFSTLLGAPVVLVDEDGSAQPDRTLAIVDATRIPERSPLQHAALITRRLVRARRHVIAFSNSRSHAELLARLATDRAVRVETYRAGYAAERRRALEAELREGRLRAVSATSALELGIDVGTIDTVVLNGFPGSIASLWQRIGRAGRSGQAALGVLVLGQEPAARAIVADPEGLLAHPSELAIANVQQPSVVRRALELAASELPVDEAELAAWGEPVGHVATELVTGGVLVRTPTGLETPGRRPHRFRPLVAMEPTWEVRFSGTRAPLAPERMAESQALREAYRGAILLHAGRAFRVVSVDHAARVALARPEPEPGHHTQAGWFRAITPTRMLEQRTLGALTLELATAVLIEQVTTAKEFRGSLLIAQRKVNAPSRAIPGESLALRPGRAVDPQEAAALHGVEHLLTKALPAIAVGAGEITALTQVTPDPHIVLFAPDNLGGGTMLGAVARRLDRALAIASRIAESCRCEDGCPFCTLDARCDDEIGTKIEVVQVLARLRAQLDEETG